MTDEQLLQLLKRGDMAALDALVSRYHAPIQAYMQRMLQNYALAEDLAQECFVRVIDAVRRNRLPVLFKPWVYKIATNLCRDYWRKGSTGEQPVEQAHFEALAAPDNVAQAYEQQLERERVIAALGELAPERRQLLVLRFYQELKLEEIAEVLDIPLSTAKTRLYDTIKQMNRILNRQGQQAQAGTRGGNASAKA